MSKLYKTISMNCEFKDIDSKSRTVVFQFANYDNVDSYEEVSTQGMFTRSINNNMKRIKHLMNHDATQVPGVAQKIWDDSTGAYMESKIGTHALGNDYLEMANSGIITEHSYGFQVLSSEKGMMGEKQVTYLKEVKLWEASSLTAWGANEKTPLLSVVKAGDILNLEDGVDAIIKRATDRMERVEKFCKNATVSDDTIELLLIEIKQLHTLIAEIMSTGSAAEATHSDDEAKVKAEQDEALARIKLMEFKLN
jgi:HK97 family phage prohead protease